MARALADWSGRAVIRGEGVVLRATEPGDAESIARWFNDPEVRRYMGARFPGSLVDQRRRLESRSDPEKRLGLCIDTLDGRTIGICSLHRDDAEGHNAGLGIMIGEKDCWSKGYGTDATLTLCCFGFRQMDLHRIRLDVYTFNERAIRSYEKCGFRRDAVQRDAYYKHGEYLDVLIMAILADEFREKWPERSG